MLDAASDAAWAAARECARSGSTVMPAPRPLVLVILDGFGEREERDANAVRLANAPNLAKIREKYPRTLLGASGRDVGLPQGQMGNSEVGHLNFGAGRVAEMDLSRIDNAVAENQLGRNPVLGQLVTRVAHHKIRMPGHDDEKPARFHLLGLVSNGGVHSSFDHLFALINMIAWYDVPIVVHAFLDGRDTAPRSAREFLVPLEEHLRGRGIIGTVSGRYYAMDRDKHWDRVRTAFDAMVLGKGRREATVYDVVSESYEEGVTDEFIVPTCIGDYSGMYGWPVCEVGGPGKPIWEWMTDEVALCFNFRPDRMRELCAMLLAKNLPTEVAEGMILPGHVRIRPFFRGNIAGMTEYDPKLEMDVAFTKDIVTESFGELVSRAGKKQFRCAETEKYAHVTYFFNGGREAAFEGEERKLIPSPRDVATYDKKPEMSAEGVTRAVVDAIESDAYDFILVNYANPDMVGHTGVLEAATHAVEAVDKGIGALADAVLAKGGVLLITADHGNCETMVDAKGNPHTAHTTNPVPFYFVSKDASDMALRAGGRLADVAPTMLEILGLEQPAAMTGRSLRVPRGE